MDADLVMALLDRETRGMAGAEDGISVMLHYEGDLAAIEALGFRTYRSGEDRAAGFLAFRDLDALVAHPGVRWISVPTEPPPHLDTAVVDIGARALFPNMLGIIGGGLWHVDAEGALQSLADATGKGVIVAIIDSGIDYTHPMFMGHVGTSETDPDTTRILRIWDQGLEPLPGQSGGPELGLADGTFGVLYHELAINNALDESKGPRLRHRDCTGHGTHVASIAAGGPGRNSKYVGVAPQASLIIVKAQDVPPTRFRRADGTVGREVIWQDRFEGAILYCLRTAREMQKAVVINISFGPSSKPGDGLDPEARFIDGLLDPSKPEGPNNFPRGAIVVKTAGNDGEPGRAAKVTMPPSRSVLLPLDLFDMRSTQQMKREHCRNKLHEAPIQVHLWYRADPTDSPTFAFKLPGLPVFTSPLLTGLSQPAPFKLSATLPAVAAIDSAGPYSAVLSHGVDEVADYPSTPPVQVRRRHVTFSVKPKKTSHTVTYPIGRYVLKIDAAPGTEIFVVCAKESWVPGLYVTFQVGSGAGIAPTSESTAVDTFGKNAITVASYAEGDGVTPAIKAHAISPNSSRGPLRDFSNPRRGPIAGKPDIAAPGVKIMAAQSRDDIVLAGKLNPAEARGLRFATKSGSSMAAPMVAGVVALLLDKNKNLSTDDVRKLLQENIDIGTDPPPTSPRPSPHDHAYGAGRVNARASHSKTTP